MFGRDWQPAEATIIEATKAIYNLKKNYKVVVEVRPQGEAPFRTEMGIPGRETHFKFPTTGPVASCSTRSRGRSNGTGKTRASIQIRNTRRNKQTSTQRCGL